MSALAMAMAMELMFFAAHDRPPAVRGSSPPAYVGRAGDC